MSTAPQLGRLAGRKTAAHTIGSGDNAKNSQLGEKGFGVKYDFRVPTGAFQQILLGQCDPLKYEIGLNEAVIFAEY